MSRVEFAGRNERVDLVVRRLIGEIRQEDGFGRITVVTPTNQASFYLRRTLAKDGLFNVDFKRLEDVAELIAGSQFSKPNLHDLQASELVYQSAMDGSLGKRLGGNSVTPQLQSALHSTFRELELLDRSQLDRLAESSEVNGELVRRFNKYMQLAETYRRGSMVAETAARLIAEDPGSSAVTRLGSILLVEASAVVPMQRPLFDALAKLDQTTTVSIVESKKSKTTASHIEPVSVPDVAEEIQDVVRSIVNLAKAGEKFSRMAVVFEDDSYANRIAESLEFAGIPVSGPDRTALSETPEGRFVNGLLDVFKGEFSRLDLTAWLSSAPIKDPRTGVAIPAARWDAISRKAGVTEGVYDSWVARLERFAKNVVRYAERSDQLSEGRVNQVEAAKTDAHHATQLKEFVIDLSRRVHSDREDSWIEFVSWLRELVNDYLIVSEDDPSSANMVRLEKLLDRLESLEGNGLKPHYEHCAGVLREQLDRRSAGLRSLGAGVYVGPVWTAAGCPFETVFVVGMSEGRYPSWGQTDPLLPDPLKRELDPEGNSLTTIQRRIETNRQAFISVVESANRAVFYWPSGIPGESREFGPARWFLDAVREVSGEDLLQAGRLIEGDVNGLTVKKRFSGSETTAAHAGDLHEYDVVSVRDWVSNEGEETSFPLVSLTPEIKDSLTLEQQRESSEWTEFDGKVALHDNDSGSEDFAVGSATAFETYAACPYRYFLSRRLNIEPTDSPEPEVALDALTFGTLIHDVLEKFSLWRMDQGDDAPSHSDQESWLRSSVERNIEQLKDETPGRSAGAWRIELSRAWLILRQWLRRERGVADHPNMRQVEAEYSFGSIGSSRRGSGPAVEVVTESGRSVRFRGQVDRVDISEDGSRVIVYDYKSGGNSAYSKLESDPVKRGTKLQLPLYSKAVGHKYPDAEIFASYWFVRENLSELKPYPLEYQNEKAESALGEVVGTIFSGIKSGVFPARPGNPAGWGESSESFENCMFCEYARVCPKSKSRLWHNKKGSDESLADYVDLAEGDR